MDNKNSVLYNNVIIMGDEVLKAQIQQLIREGKTYREIMEITGLKSTSAVAHHAKGIHSHRLFQYRKLQSDDSPYWYCRICGWEFLESRAGAVNGNL